MTTPSDPVRDQYERYPYPPPATQTLEEWAHYVKVYEVFRNLIPRFWPMGKPRQNLRILSAGCGTMAAALYAQLYPTCAVTGIDISRSALAHQETLKAQHGLKNLELRQCAVEDVGSLGMSFDYISCHGVLHHTADPVLALKALGNALAINGIFRLSLYGKYPRLHVYAFQELFRMMGLEQTPADIALARQTLMDLPPEHPLQSYLRGAFDHATDAGLVDTYLHARDRPYSVAECLKLVADAGLVFQGWDSNFAYYPDGPLRNQPALRQRLEALPDEQIWQAMEIISGDMRMHGFHVCRPDRDPASYRIPWDSDRLLDCTPAHCVDLQRVTDKGSVNWALGRGDLPPVPISASQAAVVSKMDGVRTVRQCLEAAGITGINANLIEAIKPLLQLLHHTGYGVLVWPK